ncbi:hypothetical protein ACQ4LE_001334 [Meloidogyne hapla]|uniref:LIM zinc-binding domain-containing protein n=1 Tax=Meloidogyne hapla TaxID=6305 RepID=A0A1I8C1R1_MELHA
MTSPLCDKCSEPISSLKQEPISTASKRLFHRKCFCCSKRQCGKLLQLGEYGVHQGQIFCPNCFIFLYKHGNTNGITKEKYGVEESKNNKMRTYEHQLRTLQLHEDEENEEETDEEDKREGEEEHELILESENGAIRKISNGELNYLKELSPRRNTLRRPFETSPILEVDDERESLPSPKPVSVIHSPSTWRVIAASNESFFSPNGKTNGMNGNNIGANIVCFRPSNCKRCTGRVYEAEKVVAASEVWHKCCFRCLRCGRSLEPGKFSDRAGEIYCNSCYAKEFGPKGVGCGLGAGILQMHQ